MTDNNQSYQNSKQAFKLKDTNSFLSTFQIIDTILKQNNRVPLLKFLGEEVLIRNAWSSLLNGNFKAHVTLKILLSSRK